MDKCSISFLIYKTALLYPVLLESDHKVVRRGTEIKESGVELYVRFYNRSEESCLYSHKTRYIDVGDECWRRNVLVVTIGFWSFDSPYEFGKRILRHRIDDA